jgi:hypothetical protein
METINLTVREGDSFDELFLAYQKPVGTSHDFSSSELSAQIRSAFSSAATIDSFNVQKLATTGHLKLSLTSAQTEAMARNIQSGYIERNVEYDVARQAVDPVDVDAKFLWDLKELFYIAEGNGIASIGSGTTIDEGLSQYRIRVTTSGGHNLAASDIIRIAGASVSGYNQTYTTNTVSIVSDTVFEIVPGSGGTPNFSANASGGTLNVLKEDTIVLGTLQVIPRISVI